MVITIDFYYNQTFVEFEHLQSLLWGSIKKFVFARTLSSISSQYTDAEGTDNAIFPYTSIFPYTGTLAVFMK